MIDGQMDGWIYRQIYTQVHIMGMGWMDGWTSEQSVQKKKTSLLDSYLVLVTEHGASCASFHVNHL